MSIAPRNHQRLLFLGTEDDRSYLHHLKHMVGTASCNLLILSDDQIQTFAQIKSYCESRGITGILSSHQKFLDRLMGPIAVNKPKLDNYAGSLIKRDGLEIVFIDPLKQLISVPYGKHITARYISKLTDATSWPALPEFKWVMLDSFNCDEILAMYQDALAIGVDIETIKTPLSITHISYTALFADSDGQLSTHTSVLQVNSVAHLYIMRRFNWELKPPKVFQNGKYDNAYLTSWHAPIYNWLFDTVNLMHAWYSELPKDLAFIQSYCVRESMYWKDLADSPDEIERCEYNGLDTWATVCAFAYLITHMPSWAKENFLKKFPMNFPAHLCEMTGIKCDAAKMDSARAEHEAKIAQANASLDKMLGVKGFNTNSPVQVKSLLKILGCADIPSTNEKDLDKASYRHPINTRILDHILDVRGWRKVTSTYLVPSKVFNGRILYSINPHGTDTGRNSSNEHHFWTGLNIQNQPRGPEVKQIYKADPGFYIAECDLEQAESRDTAYIIGAESLIKAVSGERDFHSVNASSFFGIPYQDIYDDELKKTINKVIRDIAKKVNHGANYNMGPDVLVSTMGLKNIYKAAFTLKLPKLWTPRQIAEYLLGCFHKTYPELTQLYYPAVKTKIKLDRLLVGATGWTRYCFGDPEKSKPALNAYVAHAPQSLNAMTLDTAFWRVFREIAMNPSHSQNFKLLAQIHDSILFQYRQGHDYLVGMVQDMMQIPVTVKGYDGNTRTFIVPAAAKIGTKGKLAEYWSETE